MSSHIEREGPLEIVKGDSTPFVMKEDEEIQLGGGFIKVSRVSQNRASFLFHYPGSVIIVRAEEPEKKSSRLDPNKIGNLVLSRNPGQSFLIGDNIVLKLDRIESRQAHISLSFSSSLPAS